ncbi:MAG: FAD-linked oxidase C-terminal domain-containing protein [Acidobacteriota bacterium]
MHLNTLLSSLGTIYPPGRIFSEAAQLAPYESDALTAFRVRPLAVVLAETQEEVIDTVRFCHREQIPFVARGSGTSLSGGSLPVEEGIVIGLNRLNRIVRLDPRQRIAVVESGVINSDVSRAAAPHGLYYAPDPSSQSICTIGGNVAFNSGGAHCLKHGMTSNHVLGIKAVLPDGEIVRLGSESLEGTGPDLTGFFCGSEGLFGVALEITLRLVPKPESYQTVLAAYDSMEAAGQAVAQVIAAGFLPGAVEIMDRLAIQAAEAAVHARYPQDAAALLIVELEGESVEVQTEFERLLEVIRSSGTFELRVAKDDADRARIWKGRKSSFSAVGRLSPDFIVQDAVVPRSRLGEALAEIDKLSLKYGIRVANVFHAGDGNLHPLILFDGTQPGALERAEELAGEIVKMCIQFGGSITGEHGVGMEKRAFLADMFSPVDLEIMRRVRRAIDPYEISNRGKMFPEESPRSEATGPRPEATGLRPGEIGLKTREQRSEGVVLKPRSIEEVQEAVRQHRYLIPRAGGSKPALWRPNESLRPQASGLGPVILDLSALSGIIEYQPEEFTFTALAGTPIQTIKDVLAEQGQFLPFDPILVKRGATLGGSVAAGASGPGRYRYGGLRDFLIGVRLVTGTGELLHGGGKVVKNAAGFDFPKLVAGSCGRLGVLVELTFKVFPRPEEYATLKMDYSSLEGAMEGLYCLTSSSLDLDALDLQPPGCLWVRLGGRKATLPQRLARLGQTLEGHPSRDHPKGTRQAATFEGPEEESLWEGVREFHWAPSSSSLLKIPLTPNLIPDLERNLPATSLRRYSAGGNVCWLAWPGDLGPLDPPLESLGLNGLLLQGPASETVLVSTGGEHLAQTIKASLDPEGKF